MLRKMLSQSQIKYSSVSILAWQDQLPESWKKLSKINIKSEIYETFTRDGGFPLDFVLESQEACYISAIQHRLGVEKAQDFKLEVLAGMVKVSPRKVSEINTLHFGEISIPEQNVPVEKFISCFNEIFKNKGIELISRKEEKFLRMILNPSLNEACQDHGRRINDDIDRLIQRITPSEAYLNAKKRQSKRFGNRPPEVDIPHEQEKTVEEILKEFEELETKKPRRKKKTSSSSNTKKEAVSSSTESLLNAMDETEYGTAGELRAEVSVLLSPPISPDIAEQNDIQVEPAKVTAKLHSPTLSQSRNAMFPCDWHKQNIEYNQSLYNQPNHPLVKSKSGGWGIFSDVPTKSPTVTNVDMKI